MPDETAPEAKRIGLFFWCGSDWTFLGRPAQLMNTASDHWREYWHHDGTLPRAIVALILVVFAQTLWFDFVFWDDNVYVYSNPDIRYVTVGGIKRAFTSLVTSHWHPVTTLFHMADAALFGMNPGADHAVNGQFGR